MACSTPTTIKNPQYGKRVGVLSHIPVPCGKCPSCLNRRTDSWIFRIMQTERHADSSTFVTLTYDPSLITLDMVTAKGYLTLVKSHFQLFMKRLRKSSEHLRRYVYTIDEDTGETIKTCVNPIKYFACGEYGDTYERPHFHAIILNADNDLIDKAWDSGFVHFGTATGDSAAYTTKYMHKGKIIPRHENDDRIPEFQLFSHGLGKEFLTPEMHQYYQADITRLYVTTDGGYRKALPRYYRERLYSESQRHRQADLSQALVNQIEDKKRLEFESLYGNTDNFYRAANEARKAEIVAFKANLKGKRNREF